MVGSAALQVDDPRSEEEKMLAADLQALATSESERSASLDGGKHSNASFWLVLTTSTHYNAIYIINSLLNNELYRLTRVLLYRRCKGIV